MAAVVAVAAVVVLVQQLGSAKPTLGWTPTPGTKTISTKPSASASAKPSSSAPKDASAIDPASGLAWVKLADLPREASDTMKQIKAGPPYKYPKNDGVVYHNANRVLPKQPDGYYHEFTVITPGSKDRGARRIIAGGPKNGQQNSEWYYTDDHYTTFARIQP